MKKLSFANANPIYLYAQPIASLNNLYLENQTIALMHTNQTNSTKIVSLRTHSSGNIFNIIYSDLHPQALTKLLVSSLTGKIKLIFQRLLLSGISQWVSIRQRINNLT